MFCTQCGTRFNDGAQFCTQCGTPAAEAHSSPVSPSPQVPVDAPIAPLATRPDTRAPAPAAAPATGLESILYAQPAVRAKPSGRGWWNYDVLVTDKRVVARKSGWMSNIAKGVARGAGPSGGLAGAQALGALGSAAVSAAAASALSASMGHASVPRWHDAKSCASAEVDEFLLGGKEPVQYPCQEIVRVIFKKGGFFGTPSMIVRTSSAEFAAEVALWKELHPVMQQLLGARCLTEK